MPAKGGRLPKFTARPKLALKSVKSVVLALEGEIMIRTNVYATEEEIKELKKLLIEARSTPVIALSVAQGISGKDLASQARESLIKKCHSFALAHNLPEMKGYYGCDLSTGEFLK